MTYRSAEKRIELLPQVTAGGCTITSDSPPAGLVHRADLGVLHPAAASARRVWIDEFTCHPRSIITPDGNFLLFFAAGPMHYAWAKNERRGNVMLVSRSQDRGVTWSTPEPAWDIPYSQHAAIPFIPAGSKQIYVFGTEPRPDVYDGVENAAIGFRRSDDDGRTWSEVTIIRPTNAPDFRGMSAMRMCETADGTWVLGTHAGEWKGKHVETRQYVLRSQDHGGTWTLLPGPPPAGWQAPGTVRMEEGRAISLGGNRVLLMTRTPTGRLWEVRSDDAGRTWSTPKATPLAHPDAPPMLFHLADGKTLIAFHHNSTLTGNMTHVARAELWCSLSGNDGVTWSEPRLVAVNTALPAQMTGWAGSSPMVSYADLLADGDDLHLFIDHQVRQVLHLHFRRQDIESFPTAASLRSST